jgi:hypothetical protein
VTRPMRAYVAFGFASVHDALAAEAALKESGIAATTIPAPRELGQLCGIALRVVPQDADAARRALSAAGREPQATADIQDF